MKKTKKKILKVSMMTLALTMGLGYVSYNNPLTPTYAQSTQDKETVELINGNTKWSYLDNNVDPGTSDDRYAWTKSNYDISSWKEAVGKFGAKNGVLSDLGGGYTPTVLLNQYIGDSKDDIPSFFFRTTIQIDNKQDIQSITGKLAYDDAAIVYMNGMKVAAFDEPSEGFETNMSYGGSNASAPKEGNVTLSSQDVKDILKDGENVIAVEIHQGRINSSDIYFEMSQLQINYKNESIQQKAINLTVGANEKEMNLTWYANSTQDGEVQIVKSAQLINGQFPEKYDSIQVKKELSNDGNYQYYQTTIKNLQENTNYAYRLVNEDKVSDVYTFQTQNFNGTYNFILAGDPQIGASGNTTQDIEGWDQTLEDSVTKFQPNFILSVGDQVNTATNESQYAGYLEHEELTNIPQATTVGNHDTSSNAYSQHFYLPNVTELGKTTAGSDYWYVYNHTLFMNINSNNLSTAEHKAFMEDAIKKNSDVRWKVVVFHHSVYSAASHAVENDILQRREQLTPVFDELGIDVVLMGHDHVYVRSHIMKDMKVIQDTTNLSSVKDPDGILYITANSASGSKYYNIQSNIDTYYAAKIDQSKQRSISNIEVSENEFKVTTYLYNNNSNQWLQLDEFSIVKSVETNQEKVILKGGKDIKTEIEALEGSIEKGAILQVDDIVSGDVYENIQSELDHKDIKMLNIILKKNDQEIQVLKTVQLKLTIPEEYNANKIALYKVEKDHSLLPVEFIIEDNHIVVSTNELGEYVIVNLAENNQVDQPNDDQSQTQKPSISDQSNDNQSQTQKPSISDQPNENQSQTQKPNISDQPSENQDQTQKPNISDQPSENQDQTQKPSVSDQLNDSQNQLTKPNNIDKSSVDQKNQTVSNDSKTQKSPITTSSQKSVQTGDKNDMLIYGVLLFSALGCGVIVKKNKKES